jgi:hypothetical protein
MPGKGGILLRNAIRRWPVALCPLHRTISRPLAELFIRFTALLASDSPHLNSPTAASQSRFFVLATARRSPTARIRPIARDL